MKTLKGNGCIKPRVVIDFRLSPPSSLQIQTRYQSMAKEGRCATANKISKQASVRGTKIHSLCEDYVNNEELDFDKLSFVEVDMFNQMKPLIDRIDNIHCVEQFLYSEHLRLAVRQTVLLNLMVDSLSLISRHPQNSKRNHISRITLLSVLPMQSCLRKELVFRLTLQ